MKAAGLACLSLFVIASLFGQSNNLSFEHQSAGTVAQPAVFQPIMKARSKIRNGNDKLPLSFKAAATKATAARRKAASMSGSLFANEYTYNNSGGSGPVFVTLADVNGDGKLDLLVANGGCDVNCNHGAVGVLLGNGDGTFQPAVAYGSGGFEASAIAVADVNGDGKPDLILANLCPVSSDNCNSHSGVGVLLGNGDGTFQAAVSYDSGGYGADSIAVADLNGDGKPDLLVANNCVSLNACNENGSDSGNLGVLLGNGDGTFQPAVTYSSGGISAHSVAVTDLNGDGKPDVVVVGANACTVVCNNGIASVFLGNGDGTLQPAVIYSSGGTTAESVAIADVNLDGKPDLVIANNGSFSFPGAGPIGVLLGNGDGTFRPAVNYGSDVDTPGSVAVADVNGDGNPDIVVGNFDDPSTSNIGVLLGNGDGTFQAKANYAIGLAAIAVAVGDLNGDGRPEIVVANGGDIFNPNTSVGVLINISLGATTTILASSSNPSNYGQNVTFTATVAPPPGSGKVIFVDGNSILATPTVSGGTATFSTTALSIGRHDISAVYSGGSASTVLPQFVNQAVSTTTLVSSVNPSRPLQSVTFTATVSSPSPAGTPTGTVQFVKGTTVLATVVLASGSAKYTINSLPVGSNIITSVYSGDSNNNGSTSTLNQIVQAATTTTVTSSPNPSAFGQTVQFTATVNSSSGAPPNGETVTFKEGATVLGTGTLSSGSASFSTSTLKVGTNAVTAVYGGDANFEASISKADSQVVSKATSTTTLISSLNPSIFGQSVTFTATVAPQFGGTPTGTVTFKNGTVGLKVVALSNGVATYTTSTLAVGNASITAVYSGSISFTASISAPLSQVVNQASTTTTLVSSLNPSNFKQTVTITATVVLEFGGTVTGTVTFQDGTTTLGTVTLSGGSAKYAISTLAVGTHNITATFNGSTSFTASAASLTQMVN